MGFIRYHGEPEDRYEEVTEYARMQKKLENIRLDEEKKQKWLETWVPDACQEAGTPEGTLKLLKKSYLEAKEEFWKICVKLADGVPGQIPLKRLWNDLWLYTTAEHLKLFSLPEEVSGKLLKLFLEKIFGTEEAFSREKYQQRLQSNRRYRKYLRQCFALQPGEGPAFWRVFQSRKLVKFYRYCLMFQLYFLYQKLHPYEAGWQLRAETEQVLLKDWEQKPLEKKMDHWRNLCNPLHCRVPVPEGLRFRRKVVFPGKKPHSLEMAKQRREEGEDMLEELYEQFEEEFFSEDPVKSILPEQAASQITQGKLPKFSQEAFLGASGETIHYLEHAVWYEGKEKGDEILFAEAKGTLAVTENRMLFQGGRAFDLELTKIRCVVLCGTSPQLLEVEMEDGFWYFRVPDAELLYRIFQLTAEKQKGVKLPEEKLEIDESIYKKLAENPDLDACIFAYECLAAYELPEELQKKVLLLVRKLKGLRKILEQYPDRKDEIWRFLSYYIPEGIRLVLSWHTCAEKGLSEGTMETLYGKIREAIDTLDAAVEQKITDIYRLETMQVISRAEALKQILEQEGYSEEKRILKH